MFLCEEGRSVASLFKGSDFETRILVGSETQTFLSTHKGKVYAGLAKPNDRKGEKNINANN